MPSQASAMLPTPFFEPRGHLGGDAAPACDDVIALLARHAERAIRVKKLARRVA